MYSPRFNPPNDLAGLIRALGEEFNNIAQAQYDRKDVLELPTLYAEPSKPRNGMVAYADGVIWNPTGAGDKYVGYSDGVWVKLG
jgi:hypothetical protein